MFYRDGSDADFVKACELHVAMINKGIEGLPPDRVRLHVCYGNWEGPHMISRSKNSAGALSGQSRRAVDRVLQSAARARIHGAAARAASQNMILIPGVVELDQQFRRAP